MGNYFLKQLQTKWEDHTPTLTRARAAPPSRLTSRTTHSLITTSSEATTSRPSLLVPVDPSSLPSSTRRLASSNSSNSANSKLPSHSSSGPCSMEIKCPSSVSDHHFDCLVLNMSLSF